LLSTGEWVEGLVRSTELFEAACRGIRSVACGEHREVFEFFPEITATTHDEEVSVLSVGDERSDSDFLRLRRDLAKDGKGVSQLIHSRVEREFENPLEAGVFDDCFVDTVALVQTDELIEKAGRVGP
jgi:hypothetical protein